MGEPPGGFDWALNSLLTRLQGSWENTEPGSPHEWNAASAEIFRRSVEAENQDSTAGEPGAVNESELVRVVNIVFKVLAAYGREPIVRTIDEGLAGDP